MTDGGICNASPRCAEKFHERLFDLQICVLRHVNLSKDILVTKRSR